MEEVPKECMGYSVRALSGSTLLEWRLYGWNLKWCHEFKTKEFGLYLIGTFFFHLFALFCLILETTFEQLSGMIRKLILHKCLSKNRKKEWGENS